MSHFFNIAQFSEGPILHSIEIQRNGVYLLYYGTCVIVRNVDNKILQVFVLMRKYFIFCLSWSNSIIVYTKRGVSGLLPFITTNEQPKHRAGYAV